MQRISISLAPVTIAVVFLFNKKVVFKTSVKMEKQLSQCLEKS